VFSSRKLERATYDSVAFRFIAANQHPDHDTIAAFRRRFLPQIEALFVQVLLLAREMGVLQLGTVALDGTKIHANASRHSALSYEHAGQIEAQLRAEVPSCWPRPKPRTGPTCRTACRSPRSWRAASSAWRRSPGPGRSSRRGRGSGMPASKPSTTPKWRRAAKAAASGRKPRGMPPVPPVEGPGLTDRVNLTDEESRIMPVPGGGFEQRCNAQACVAAGCLPVAANNVVQAANDKQQVEPMLGQQADVAGGAGPGRNTAGRHRLFQRSQCAGLRGGGHRSVDGDGTAAAPSTAR
jgi:hypothetical protein